MAPRKLRMKLRSRSGGKKEERTTLASMLSGVPVSGLIRAAKDPEPREEEFKAMFKNMPKFAANAFEFASAFHTARKPGSWYPQTHLIHDVYVPRYGPTSLGPAGFDTSASQRAALEEEAQTAEAYGDDLRVWLARKQPDDELPPLSEVLRKMEARDASADDDSRNNAFIIGDDSNPDYEPKSRTRLYKQAFRKMVERFETKHWKSEQANRRRKSRSSSPEVVRPATAPPRKVIPAPGPKSAAASAQVNSKAQKNKGARSKKLSPSHQTARKRPAKQQAPQTPPPQALPDNGTCDKNMEPEGPRETIEALFARLAAEASTEGQATVGTATRPRRTWKPSRRTDS